jgi:AcrR family transcriptional regulator
MSTPDRPLTRARKTPGSTPEGRRGPAFGRDEWLAAARRALIAGGVDDVKIDRLSKKVGVRRSSFYWHFSSRARLLDALLDHWEATNTGPILRAVDAAIAAGPGGIHDLALLWIEEREFNPAYDTAVRDWARKDPAVARVVRAVDEKRIAALSTLMKAYGYRRDEALIRARILYFHQVGYYALGMHESKATRKRLEPLYIKALVGYEV